MLTHKMSHDVVYESEELDEDDEEDEEDEDVQLSMLDIRAACNDDVCEEQHCSLSSSSSLEPDEHQNAKIQEFHSRIRQCTSRHATHFTRSAIAARDSAIDECNDYMREVIGMHESGLLRKAVSYFYDWVFTTDVVYNTNRMLLSMDMYQVWIYIFLG
jgi:hypothetical protein